MSKTMKWIIGVLAGLAIVFFIFSVGYLVLTNLNNNSMEISTRSFRTWEGERAIPRYGMPWGHIPMQPNRWMSDGFFQGFFPFGNVFGVLFCLGFLVLIGLGATSLILILRRSPQPASAFVSDVPSAPLAEPTIMETPTHPCPNCQLPVIDEWKHCPNCGTALTPQD